MSDEKPNPILERRLALKAASAPTSPPAVKPAPDVPTCVRCHWRLVLPSVLKCVRCGAIKRSEKYGY